MTYFDKLIERACPSSTGAPAGFRVGGGENLRTFENLQSSLPKIEKIIKKNYSEHYLLLKNYYALNIYAFRKNTQRVAHFGEIFENNLEIFQKIR